MPESWERALSAYSYCADLSTFVDAHLYPGWFELDLKDGDLAETSAFESRFRENAPFHLEAWYEVVYWKLSSQPRVRNGTTRRAIDRISNSGVTAETLWNLCQSYRDAEDLNSFRKLRKHFFVSDVVATTATFPAFIDPENFPMADRHVADWAKVNRKSHSYSRQGGPVLCEAPTFSKSLTVLRYDKPGHWEFVSSWIQWCRFVARRLSHLSDRRWRARDVEMAVWAAQSNNMRLNSIA